VNLRDYEHSQAVYVYSFHPPFGFVFDFFYLCLIISFIKNISSPPVPPFSPSAGPLLATTRSPLTLSLDAATKASGGTASE
jgi:hypothetical protein